MTYVWADTTDGAISLRSRRPACPVAANDVVWDSDVRSYSSGRGRRQHVHRLCVDWELTMEVNQFRRGNEGVQHLLLQRRGVQAHSQDRDQPLVLRAPPLEPQVRRRAASPEGHGHRRGNGVHGAMSATHPSPPLTATATSPTPWTPSTSSSRPWMT